MNLETACGAYWYCADHHSGQSSREYRVLSKLSRIYTPGPMESSSRLLRNERGEYEDAKDVYARLCKSAGEPCWDVELADDGTMDTVFSVYCRTCERSWDERFCSEYRRFEDDEEDAESLREMTAEIFEEMYVGSGACHCTDTETTS